MFNSDDEDALGLLSQNHETDKKIDLSGLDEAEALEIISSELASQSAINKINSAQSKIWFYFPLAEGGSKTLFLPVGNLLRQKLKNGEIIRAMPAQNGGWIVRL